MQPDHFGPMRSAKTAIDSNTVRTAEGRNSPQRRNNSFKPSTRESGARARTFGYIRTQPPRRYGRLNSGIGLHTTDSLFMHVIFLHGAPASGKYTVGVKLSRLTGIPLFHNHLAVDAALGLFAFGTPSFNRLRATIWQAAFEEAAKANQSFIFTFNPESTVAPGLISELCKSIQSVNGRIYFIQLTCSRETILNRLGLASRAASGKLTDPGLFKSIEAQGAFNFPAFPQALVVVDTDEHDADAAALIIADAVGTAQGDA